MKCEISEIQKIKSKLKSHGIKLKDEYVSYSVKSPIYNITKARSIDVASDGSFLIAWHPYNIPESFSSNFILSAFGFNTKGEDEYTEIYLGKKKYIQGSEVQDAEKIQRVLKKLGYKKG